MAGYYEFISLTLEPDRLWHGIRDVSSKIHHEFLCRHNVEDPQLRALMHTLMAEAEAANPNGRLFVESLILAVSIHFVKHYSAETKFIPEYRTGLTSRQLHRTFEYIEANLTEEISLDTLAKEVNLSKYYFSRLFKRSTGLTPYQYVLQRRLERAKAFLKHGESSIVEIAHLFGFSDQSHFSRLFRKQYGITPGNFLKNNHVLMTS
jgi:AraC family transcriptional regulator